MRQRFFWICLFAAASAGGAARAVAAVEPLVVVVESTHGTAVDPAEVRKAIAAELRTTVRAPRDEEGDEGADLLIVALDQGEIRMSLRLRATSVVSRVVPAPSDRKARLRAIGWLAGNLARDQVSSILSSAPGDPVVSAASVEEKPTSIAEVPPAARPATEPPPLARNEAGAPTPVAAVVVARPTPAAASDGSRWSLTLGGGPSALWSWAAPPQRVWPGPGIWYLALQREASGGGLILGAALEAGPDMGGGLPGAPKSFMAGAALVGVSHRFGRPFVEATAGLGVEAYQAYVVQTTIISSEGGVHSEEIASIGIDLVGFLLRAQATAGLSLSRSFDLLASVGGHVGSVTRLDRFLTGGLAVRYRFPQ